MHIKTSMNVKTLIHIEFCLLGWLVVCRSRTEVSASSGRSRILRGHYTSCHLQNHCNTSWRAIETWFAFNGIHPLTEAWRHIQAAPMANREHHARHAPHPGLGIPQNKTQHHLLGSNHETGQPNFVMIVKVYSQIGFSKMGSSSGIFAPSSSPSHSTLIRNLRYLGVSSLFVPHWSPPVYVSIKPFDGFFVSEKINDACNELNNSRKLFWHVRNLGKTKL